MVEYDSFADRVEAEGLTIDEQIDAYDKAVLPVLECEFCGQKAASSEGKSEAYCIGDGCAGMMVDTGETKEYEI